MLFKEKKSLELTKNSCPYSVVLITNEKKKFAFFNNTQLKYAYIIILYIRACDLKNVYIYYKYKL